VGGATHRSLHDLFAALRRRRPREAIHEAFVRGANVVVPFKILVGIVADAVDPAFAGVPDGYVGRFLSRDELLACAEDSESELRPDFVDRALARGDQCFALLRGESLAAYGWYARAPTPIDPPDLVLGFSGRYVYMYKGYTHPAHRGKRLHAIGMTLALAHYLREGYAGLVSYVESSNWASLASVRRMGYRVFGTLYVVRAFGRYFTRADEGCRRYGFRLDPAPPPS
jgi:ribosomal protein S18 acetylase RimI-like enzyme